MLIPSSPSSPSNTSKEESFDLVVEARHWERALKDRFSCPEVLTARRCPLAHAGQEHFGVPREGFAVGVTFVALSTELCRKSWIPAEATRDLHLSIIYAFDQGNKKEMERLKGERLVIRYVRPSAEGGGE